MDIDYLIDRLEALITSGKRVPLGNKIMVDEQQCLDLIDQMRAVLPEEIRAAKRTLHERERILGLAEEDAQHILQRAEEERQHIIGREGLLAEVERQRDTIITAANDEAYEMRVGAQQAYDDALQQAQEMREGANVYAMQVLQELENVLGKHMGMVQNGLKSFQQQIEQYQRQLDQYHQQYRPNYVKPETGLAPTTNGTRRQTPASNPAPAKPAASQATERRPAVATGTQTANQASGRNTLPANQPPAINAASGGNRNTGTARPTGSSFGTNSLPSRPNLTPVPKPPAKDKESADDEFLE